ncbi:MAG: hypothetical protein AB2A00_43515 [Myxococcota bacterium]
MVAVSESVRTRVFVVGALLLAAVSLVLPLLAFPAVVAVMLVAIQQQGRARALVGVLGGAMALVATVRFTVEYAVPGIVGGGQRAGEEKAVSRLREILWAQDKARELKLVDRNGDGVAEAALASQLTGAQPLPNGTPMEVPLLRPDQFRPVAPGSPVLQSESYLYVVYLPDAADRGTTEEKQVDATRAAKRFVAYAWPAGYGKGGRRVFFMDQDERICESVGPPEYQGVERMPPAHAALQGPALSATPCGTGSDGATWTPWKKKKPRTSPPG